MKKNTFFSLLFNRFFTILFLFSLSSSFAQTIYYANSATGNDANAGTIGAPFKTFHKAYTVAVSGDILDLTGTFTWTDSDETGDVVRRGYVLDKNITIQGQGTGVTIIQANAAENTADRMVFSGTSTSVFNRLTIKRLTIRNGVSTEDDKTSGGLLIQTTTSAYNFNLTISECSFEKNRINSFPTSNSFSGGALSFSGYAYGTLNIEKTSFIDNYAYVRSYGAGALYINQTVNATIKECTFYNNTGKSNFSDTYYGTSGAIYAFRNSNVIITNSTFVSNKSDGTAGAILFSQNNATLTNNTIASNLVTSPTGIVGGVHLESVLRVNIKNNIIANNTANGFSNDFYISTGSITNNGYNIVESSNGFTFNATGDITGNQVNLFGTGVSDTPTLDNNGTIYGTQTVALSAGSVAINNGNGSPNNTEQVPLTDQRGLARGCVVDIGAFDSANNVATISGVQNMAVGGTTLQLTGSGTPASVTPWVSSNPAAATISSTGLVSAVNTGATTITYTTAEGCSVTAIINILNCASPFGNAMSFDGDNDYVVVGDTFENLADLTTEAWVYWRGSTNAFSEIFTKDLVSAFSITSTNKLHANFGNGSTWDSGLNSITSIPLNTWTHVAVTRQNGSVKLLINGIQDSATATMNTTGQNSSHRAIGAKLVGTSLYANSAINGKIDEVRFWSSARTPSQIQSSMNTELAGTESGLLAYYNFNHGVAEGNNASINTIVNLANSASNGTLTNFAKTGTNSNLVVGVTANFTISGAATICANSTGQYTHPIAGGSWSVSSGSTATISSTGLLTSTVGETLTISYSYTMNGCSYTDTKLVTIQLPVISGSSTIGVGDQITLTATTTPSSSNAWVSSNTNEATITNAGVISGLTIGTTIITYTNSNGCTATQSITVTAGATQTPVLISPTANTIGAATLNISYTLPEAPLAGSVRLTFTPTAGGTPIVWTMTNATSVTFSHVVGTNPVVANLNTVITGASLSFVTYNITLSYQDANGNPVAQVTNANIQTLAPPNISFSGASYQGIINTSLTAITLINSGGTSTYSISPSLPNGVSINTTTGVISGTPTVSLAATPFTATATNAAGSSTATFTLFIDIDTDGDGIGDTTDPDIDDDGVPNSVEQQQGTSPTNPTDVQDTDGDGVPDYVEQQQGTSPTNPTDVQDTDGDGVPDYVEQQQGTSPTNPTDVQDTDGDGVPDYVEQQQGTSPTIPGAQDTDGDGVPDYVEQQQGTSPTTPGAQDTDGDGIPDYVEQQQGTSPTRPGDILLDTDGDGVPNYVELQQGSNPLVVDVQDTDNDGISDYKEGYNYFNLGGSTDTDLDGIPNYLDRDADADGILDVYDAFPINQSEWTDSDRDGIGNNIDTDDDNDGILDACDLDTNGDDIPDNGTDMDHDGIIDSCDTDKDGDGVNNTSDNCPDTPNRDQADRDSDGHGDVCDTIELNTMQALTPNGDGINDTWVIYNLINHPHSTVRVFDANGTQVFYSANYQNNWAGSYQGSGEMLPVGSYLYQIDLGGDGSIDEQGWLYLTK